MSAASCPSAGPTIGFECLLNPSEHGVGVVALRRVLAQRPAGRQATKQAQGLAQLAGCVHMEPSLLHRRHQPPVEHEVAGVAPGNQDPLGAVQAAVFADGEPAL
ncbi:hypothetical protein RZS08_56990, partial [Arthrospira platensis SPKY1]|nr:hypothetical protein [Arthrospira platensis SPKY1]